MRIYKISDYNTNDPQLTEDQIITALHTNFDNDDYFEDTWGGITDKYDINIFDGMMYGNETTYKGTVYGLVEQDGQLHTDCNNDIAHFNLKIFDDNFGIVTEIKSEDWNLELISN